jgi:hypothetical protein
VEENLTKQYSMIIFSPMSNVHTFGNIIFQLQVHYLTEQTYQI